MTQHFATGRIVWAEIADVNGYRKLRPAVISLRLTGFLLRLISMSSRSRADSQTHCPTIMFCFRGMRTVIHGQV